MSFDHVNWLDFKIILLQVCQPVCMLLTQLLLYEQCANCWVRDEDYIVVLQQVGPEVFQRLIHYIFLLINSELIEFWSLHAWAHEGYGTFVFHFVLLSEYYN